MIESEYFSEYVMSSSQEEVSNEGLVDETNTGFQEPFFYNGESDQFYSSTYYSYYQPYNSPPYYYRYTYYPMQYYQPVYPSTDFYYWNLYYYPVQNLIPYYSSPEASPCVSPVPSSPGAEFEDYYSNDNVSPCSSYLIPSYSMEHEDNVDEEQQQSLYAENTLDYLTSDSSEESPSISPVQSSSGGEFEDSDDNDLQCSSPGMSSSSEDREDNFSNKQQEESLYDEKSEDYETANLYRDCSLLSKKKVGSHGIDTDVSPKDKNVLGVEDRINVVEDDIEAEKSKKVESRSSFFNAVSKSNCCDCYKEGHVSDNIKEDIISCPEYKKIKETEEFTNYIKDSLYTSVLKGIVRKNEVYLPRVEILPRIDEGDEDIVENLIAPVEVNVATSPADGENCPVNENSKDYLLPPDEKKQPKKRFRRLRKFFSRLCRCGAKRPEEEVEKPP